MADATVSAHVTVRAKELEMTLRSREYRTYLTEMGERILAVARPHSGIEFGDLRASMDYTVEEDRDARGRFGSTQVKGALVLELGSYGNPLRQRPGHDPNAVPYARYNWQGFTDRNGVWHEGTHPFEKACEELAIPLINPENI